jgi:hypothetical protein
VPEAFGNRAFLDLGTHDRRDQLVYQPVAHALFSPVPVARTQKNQRLRMPLTQFLDDLTTYRQRSATGLTCMTATSSIVEQQQLQRGVSTPAHFKFDLYANPARRAMDGAQPKAVTSTDGMTIKRRAPHS